MQRAKLDERGNESPAFNRQSLFARLINHQSVVLFSQNKPATSNQPQPASSTLLSEQTSTSHQPPANRTCCRQPKKYHIYIQYVFHIIFLLFFSSRAF
jgi:hypothetical protein